MFAGLDTEAYDRTYSDIELISRLTRYFKKHRKVVFYIIILVCFVSLAGAGQPLMISRGIGTLDEKPSPSLILGLFGLTTLFGIIVWLANWLRRRLTVRVIGDVISAMRHEAFEASINHDMAFFDQYSSGRIISRITSDTQEFAQIIQLVLDIASQVLLVVILLIILAYLSLSLTLMIIAMIPGVAIFTLLFRRLARFVTRKGFRVLAEVNKSIQEAVTGISIAKNFRQEEAIYEAFQEVNQQSYQVNLYRGFVLANVFPLLITLTSFGTAALLYWGGQAVSMELVTLSAWYLFMLSLDRFWFPLINISVFWSQFQAGLSAAERVFALIDAEPVIYQTDQKSVPELQGKIVFDQVCFQYTEQEKVFDDFSLQIEPGESVALVGHTGAGKSSIIKLLTRFYEFQAGQICIDNQDIRTFDLSSYRRQLGLVSQVPFLFAGTVADNIRYARPNLDDEEIETVARRIGHGEWLETLPQGLQTEVGERGGRLSMGQRQLVALTRVLVQQPAIFILDEATASVDPFTENQIQEALDLILACSTSIVIAHRLSTIRTADRILVLDKGRIIEEGNHQDLMTQKGHYAELYNAYFRHQSPDYRPGNNSTEEKKNQEKSSLAPIPTDG